MIPFKEFPKIPRLNRGMVVTEKIDGTNAQIYIPETTEEFAEGGLSQDRPFLVGSRNRWITPENDNYGFARWAYEHKDELLQLGPGQHFGEWWGSGVQKRYNLPEKRFSLFNASRWVDQHGTYGQEGEPNLPKCCYVVPTLYKGVFSHEKINELIEDLKVNGSKAGPLNEGKIPEGVVVYLVASRNLYKVTTEKDSQPKGVSE